MIFSSHPRPTSCRTSGETKFHGSVPIPALGGRSILHFLACNGEGAGPAFDPSAVPSIPSHCSQVSQVWSVCLPRPLFLTLSHETPCPDTRILRFRLRRRGSLSHVSQATPSLLRRSFSLQSSLSLLWTAQFVMVLAGPTFQSSWKMHISRPVASSKNKEATSVRKIQRDRRVAVGRDVGSFTIIGQ